MKKLFALLAAAALTPVCALAQSSLFTYEGDGFAVKLLSASDVRIASTSGMVFAADDDDDGRKVDVEVCQGIGTKGYSLVRKEINDADFFVNDDGSEMMAETPREARRFFSYMSFGRSTGVSLKVEVVDKDAPKGRKDVYLDIPSDALNRLLDAQRAAARR